MEDTQAGPWVQGRCTTTSCARARRHGNGTVELGSTLQPDTPGTRYTEDEWEAFIADVKAGEYDNL